MSSLSVLPNYSLLPDYMVQEIIRNRDANRMLSTRLPKSESVMAAPSEDPPKPRGQVSRAIYDAGKSELIPGTRIREEGGPELDDIAAKNAYKYMGITYDFFWQKFQRHSLDNKGLELKATIHYTGNYDFLCSFWSEGNKCVVFGDGDVYEKKFNHPTACIDIVARQLAYGMVKSEVDFIYKEQSGSLAESIADVFGSMVKQFYKNQTATEADWLIGEGMINSKINAKGLRSLASPGTAYDTAGLGKDPQVAHTRYYDRSINAMFNRNINSGIPNRAFYLTATKLGGYSWEKAGKIWYEALCDEYLKEDNQGRLYGKTIFFEFARLTIRKARRLFDQHTADKVRQAWYEVGVYEAIWYDN